MTIASKIKKTAAVAVLAALSFGGVQLATAAPGIGGINPDEKGSITVHKYYGDPTNTPGDGNAMETEPSLPKLEGVEFTLEPVQDVNLNTNEGWAKAANIAKGKETATFGAKVVKSTDPQGQLKFDELAVGLYRVSETNAANAKVPGSQDKVSVKTAAPFYVTIPMTASDNKSWNYNIHAYPKNQAFENKKESKVVSGDTMRYTVTSTLPKLPNEQANYEKYNLIDKLSEYHKADSFTLESVKVLKADDSEVANVAISNFEVSNPAPNPDQPGQTLDHVVLVKSKADALAALKAASAQEGTKVVWTYTVKIVDTFPEGSLVNEAWVAPSNEYADKPGEPGGGAKVTDEFITFRVYKFGVEKDDTKTPLQGAKFTVYGCTTDGKYLTTDGSAATAAPGEKSVVLKADIVTNSDGYSDIVRMPVTDANKHVQKACAVETEAPAGYTKLASHVLFDITKNKDADKTDAFVQKIENVKKNAGFEMPLTGAQSLILLSVAGVVLMGGAIFFTVRSRKEA